MNASQRRKARRVGPQPGDVVEWRDRRIGWLQGTVLPFYAHDSVRDRRVREFDGRFHFLRASYLRVIPRKPKQ